MSYITPRGSKPRLESGDVRDLTIKLRYPPKLAEDVAREWELAKPEFSGVEKERWLQELIWINKTALKFLKEMEPQTDA